MRLRARVDDNHRVIVKTLRGLGCTVTSLASVGGGVPDLLIGRHGRTYLVEVKDGRKPPSAQALTADEATWIEDWRGGPVTVLTSQTHALQWVNNLDHQTQSHDDR